MGERLQLVVAQLGADGDVVDGGERQPRARGLDAFGGVFAQTGDVAQTRGAAPVLASAFGVER